MPNPVAALVGGSVVQGYLGHKAAGDAADAQKDAAQQSLAMEKYIFDKQTELQAPFRDAGLTGQDKYMTLLGLKSPTSNNLNDPDFGKYAGDFSMSDFQADPGYAFRLSEGLKGLDRQAAARGGLISGGALKAATRYGQDMGSQEYTNAFNRYQTNRSNQLNPLQSLSGMGQTATNTLTNAAGEYGRQASSSYGDIGNARASGYVGQANALGNALSGVSNAYFMNRAFPKTT